MHVNRSYLCLMKKGKVLLVCLILVVLSCTSPESSETPESLASEEVVFEKDKNLEGLKLNLGKKWKVNHETEVGMQNIEVLIRSFDGNDYKKLGKDIKEELGQIIKLCTMKGEDHDQFHIVLHAMMKESKKLKKGKSSSTEKMSRYVDVYHAHFEE